MILILRMMDRLVHSHDFFFVSNSLLTLINHRLQGIASLGEASFSDESVAPSEQLRFGTIQLLSNNRRSEQLTSTDGVVLESTNSFIHCRFSLFGRVNSGRSQINAYSLQSLSSSHLQRMVRYEFAYVHSSLLTFPFLICLLPN